MGKRLTIRGIHKVEGWTFHNRFLLTNATVSETNYRFQFRDDKDSGRFLWVELNRNGRWDDMEGKWMYHLNYPKLPASEHKVSAGWWSDLQNVETTFEKILKRLV